jgi:hypothetical protein
MGIIDTIKGVYMVDYILLLSCRRVLVLEI